MTGADDAPRRRPRRRRWGLVLAVLLLLLAAAEIALRVHERGLAGEAFVSEEMAEYLAAEPYLAVHDDEMPYRNAPGLDTVAGGVRYRHDERGWRVTADEVTAGSPGSPGSSGAPVTVAFLGDSMTYGWGVPAEDALPELAAAALGGRIKALNLGVSAFGTTPEVRLYERDRQALSDQEVEVVVLIVFPNDFAAGPFAWHAGTGFLAVDALPLPAGLRNRLSSLALYRGLASWHSGVARREGRWDGTAPESADTVLAPLTRLIEDVVGDGRRLLIAYLPAVADLVGDTHAWQPAVLAAVCAERDVPFVDLRAGYLRAWESAKAARPALVATRSEQDALRAWSLRHWVLSLQDQHLNATGNRGVADELAPAVAALLDR